MTHEKSITLHQQDGGMSVRAFADREGLSLDQAKRFAKRGQILGARQDSRSKHWWIYPPAKLLVTPRSYTKRSAADTTAACAGLPASAASPDLLACGSAGAVGAGAQSRQSGQPAPQVKAAGIRPPARPAFGFDVFDHAALPTAERRYEHGKAASCGKSVYTEARNVCQLLHDAAVKRYREGIHYLRLDARELAQLYAALDNDRSRVRKLVGKGLLPVGLLRASDSVWQKMQAMCREGKLL
ncbi:MAG: hypothetical protein A2Z65_08835 [Gallionellales bacterium RIFCSPLOWO2_02_58_13]|nr:MAG: hypothetical protein A2Z65_08835 [Gallionellales bacterium RIFCSPLOWO2_02_58_13]